MIYHDSRDIVWITTFGNGLFAIYNTGRIQHFTVGKDLPTNYLFCVTEDKSGEIWVGTGMGWDGEISLPIIRLRCIIRRWEMAGTW